MACHMLNPPRCSGGSSPVQWLSGRGGTSWLVMAPSWLGWEGAGWSCRLEWLCHQLLSIAATCPFSPALSIILQTHKALLASGAGQDKAGTQVLCRCGRTFPCSQHAPVQMCSRFCIFSLLQGFPSFWVSDFDPTAVPPHP